MEQKEVKIIGITINEQMGILKSCSLKFNPENKLIAVKGEVGAGKSTLQKSLMLGTLGGETLKDDKQLYGNINEEVQLLDGYQAVYVGCKTNKDGSLDYVIYTKDSNGKVVKDPVIDGVKCTPASYLKSLQTALTWRMDELTSENPTVQKKLLLELYKSELADLGVVFDKKDTDYSESILGKIELAENKRAEKDFKRRQVGGFANQLEPFGIFLEEPSSYPSRIDVSDFEAKKLKIKYDIENFTKVKEQSLSALKNKADAVVISIQEENNLIKSRNKVKEAAFSELKDKHIKNSQTKSGIDIDLASLKSEGCLSIENYNELSTKLGSYFVNNSPSCEELEKEVVFDEAGKISSKSSDFVEGSKVNKLMVELESLKIEYLTVQNQPEGDTTELNKELELLDNSIILAKENNKKCEMLESYQEWHEANNEVVKLRNEYAQLLSSINTGVDGLVICVDKDGEKLDIYLTYNGNFDTTYFNNQEKEARKLSSYSGTQKPLICLLLQNYLLSRKPKAMRYLWIDNVPIDKKTRDLLERMGNELGVTVMVNITGDFDKNSLVDGEILIEGGEVFFHE